MENEMYKEILGQPSLPQQLCSILGSLWPWQHCLDHVFPRMKAFLRLEQNPPVCPIPPGSLSPAA